MNNKTPVFEDYLSCAYLGFGLSTLFVLSFQFINLDQLGGLRGIIILIIPYIIGGFVSGLLMSKKCMDDCIIVGIKCSLFSSLFFILLGYIFYNNLDGILWIITGYFIGTFMGLIVGKLKKRGKWIKLFSCF
jgi:hypothetical protein